MCSVQFSYIFGEEEASETAESDTEVKEQSISLQTELLTETAVPSRTSSEPDMVSFIFGLFRSNRFHLKSL